MCCLRLRWRFLDLAALINRHFPTRPPVLRMTVEADVAGIDFQKAAKYQLCVPAVTIRGDSYRLREKRRAGLLPKPSAATATEVSA